MKNKYDITRSDAVYALGFTDFYGPDEALIFPEGVTPPTKEEVEKKLNQLRADFDAKQYQRDREREYPSIQELVVALYDADDKAEIDKKRAEIKKKYPKPE